MNNEFMKLWKKSEQEYTPIEAAIVFLYGQHPKDAARAAAELAALRQEREEAQAEAVRRREEFEIMLQRLLATETERDEARAVVEAVKNKIIPFLKGVQDDEFCDNDGCGCGCRWKAEELEAELAATLERVKGTK